MLYLLLVTLLTGADGDASAAALLRAASHDKNLEARTAEGLRLGIVFDAKSADVRADAEAFALDARAVGSKDDSIEPVWIEMTRFSGTKELYGWLREHQVSMLFVPAGMDAVLDDIVRATESAGVLTLAGEPADVEKGLVLGARIADGSTKLVVNMAAATRSGVNFDGAVRQVALRVGPGEGRDAWQDVELALAQYADALERRDLDALKSVWPKLDRKDEQRIVASFQIAESQQISLALLAIDEADASARARVRRTDRLVTKDGKTLTAGNLVTFSLRRGADGAWLIDSMATANALP